MKIDTPRSFGEIELVSGELGLGDGNRKISSSTEHLSEREGSASQRNSSAISGDSKKPGSSWIFDLPEIAEEIPLRSAASLSERCSGA